MTHPDTAPRAIRHVLTVYHELELVGQPPGAHLVITRQQLDAALSDLGVIARLIRELSERPS